MSLNRGIDFVLAALLRRPSKSHRLTIVFKMFSTRQTSCPKYPCMFLTFLFTI